MIQSTAALALLCGCTAQSGLGEALSAENSEKSAMVTVRVIGQDGKLTGPAEVPRVVMSEAEWRKKLTPEQFAIARSKGTERAFCGTLLDNKKHGYYVCIGCDLPLFSSDSKFNSGTGWPSFFQPVAKENVHEETDSSHGMVRTEITCARCDSHLGHVFPDGPKPTGLRFCLNSESLRFVDEADVMTLAQNLPAPSEKVKTPKVGGRLPAPMKDTPLASTPGQAVAVFAGGCFWCTEAVFEELDGVKDVMSGYCGGDPKRADYESVCTGRTGHAEAIKITYDPSKITYGQLLRIFFATHNPTTLNQQGPDVGTQYRSSIFVMDDEQKAVAESYIGQLTEAQSFSKPIVTKLEPLTEFFPAEEYHQDFVKNNPRQAYVQQWALPKLKKLKEILSEAEAE